MTMPEIKGTTKITGIFGDPVTYSLSPRMHNYAFEKLGLDFVYVPFLVKPGELEEAADAVRALNIAGVNVTLPYKEAILPFLDQLTPQAKMIGAVNTVINRKGKLIGDNTDAEGFLTALRTDGKFDPKGKNAILWGAGGVARAIAVSLLEAGAKKLVIVNRTFKRAKDLVRHLKKVCGGNAAALEARSENLLQELLDCEIFLNATPVGVERGVFPFPAERFITADKFVFDAVYSKQTPLLISAEKAEAKCLGGLSMLIHQGALSFSRWTGEAPPVRFMREALEGT